MKIPVFPNWYPFNDMVFDEHLQVGDCTVKTRSWDWNYRGPVLFYTSGRVARQAVEAYSYKRNPSNHKIIIGVANLVNVRELTNREARKMVCNFNNISPAQLKELLTEAGGCREPDSPFWVNNLGYIAPYRIGFFFQDKKKFLTPVPFNWPPGPIKPIFTDTRKNKRLSEQLSLACL